MNTYYVVEFFDTDLGEWRRSNAITQKFLTGTDARQAVKKEGEDDRWYRIVRVVVQEFVDSGRPFKP